MNESPYALYRHFDTGNTLLYIGKSGDLATRSSAHIRRSQWMQFAARSTIARYASADALGIAEREAIEAEHPIFNKQYNDTPETRARLCAYLEQVGCLDLLPAPARSKPRRAREGEKTRTPHGCWDESGSRPWVPGWIGWPEAHDDCPSGACLGRTIPAAVNARLRAVREAGQSLTDKELARLRLETGRAVRQMSPEEARRLLSDATDSPHGQLLSPCQ